MKKREPFDDAGDSDDETTPWQCGVCDMTFVSYKQREAHKRKTHGEAK